MSYWTYGGDEPRYVITGPSGLAAGDESVVIRELRRTIESVKKDGPVIPKTGQTVHVYLKQQSENYLRTVDLETIFTNVEEGFYLTKVFDAITGAKLAEIEWEYKPGFRAG